jgi:hypothetical protein
MYCNNKDCELYLIKNQGMFDAVVQTTKNEAETFQMYSDVTLGINRTLDGCETPSESDAEPDKKLPYVKHIDCIECGEEIEMNESEIEKMEKLEII